MSAKPIATNAPMSDSSNRTPGPWTVNTSQDGIEGCSQRIAKMLSPNQGGDIESRANAAFIVKAVNAHDELVNALEYYAKETNYTHCDMPSASEILDLDRGSIARAALSKVRGGGGG